MDVPPKPKKQEEGARPPAPWVLTFGDLMTQLLCFFIILFSMSEIKEEDFITAMKSIQGAFKIYVSAPRQNVLGPKQTFQEALQHLMSAHKPGSDRKLSTAITWPRHGRETKVMYVREGLKVVIGGRAGFEKHSEDLSEAMKGHVDALCEALSGYRYRIEVIGHASREPFGSAEEAKYGKDNLVGDEESWNVGKRTLSYKRAANVAAHMVGQCGIDPSRIRVSAMGAVDPLKLSVADKMDYRDILSQNRRVEIIVSEERVPSGHERSAATTGGE